MNAFSQPFFYQIAPVKVLFSSISIVAAGSVAVVFAESIVVDGIVAVIAVIVAVIAVIVAVIAVIVA